MSAIYFLIPVMTLGGALGAFFFKQGAQRIENAISLFTQPKIYIGGMCYVGSALLNIYVLRYLEYSVVYPLTAITYIWSAILAKVFLGEKITRRKVLGIAAICIGVIFCV